MSRPGYPAAHPPPEEIIACTPLLRRVLALQDVEDVIRGALVDAVVAVREGRFRPNPTLHPRTALHRWIVRIATDHLGHLASRACRRFEGSDVELDPVSHVRFAARRCPRCGRRS